MEQMPIVSASKERVKELLYTYVIVRDYLMGFLVIAQSINSRPRYQPESFSSRADNGRGLILRAITKTP